MCPPFLPVRVSDFFSIESLSQTTNQTAAIWQIIRPCNAIRDIVGKVSGIQCSCLCVCTRKEVVILLGRSSERAVAVAGEVPNPKQILLSPVLSTFHCTLPVMNKPNILHHLVRPSRQIKERIDVEGVRVATLFIDIGATFLFRMVWSAREIPVLPPSPSLPILEGRVVASQRSRRKSTRLELHTSPA